MQGHSHYYENVGGKKFVERTEAFFPKTPWGAMGIKFFDFDNDGRTDLFIADMHSDMSDEPGPENEKLKSKVTWDETYIQGKKDEFIFGQCPLSQPRKRQIRGNLRSPGTGNLLAMGTERRRPVNADGWEDVFIPSGMSYPYRYGINSLLLNDHGEKFLDSEFVLGIEPRKKLYTPWFEIDCSDPREIQAQAESQ